MEVNNKVMEDCIYSKSMWKQLVRMLLIGRFLKDFDYDIVFEDDECRIRINLDSNKTIEISYELINSCKDKPYNTTFVLNCKDGSTVIIDTSWMKHWWEVIKVLGKYKEIAANWIIEGTNNEAAIKNYVTNRSLNERNKIELHDLLLNAQFALKKSDAKKKLREMNINSNDYVYRKGVFYNKATKEVVFNIGG